MQKTVKQGPKTEPPTTETKGSAAPSKRFWSFFSAGLILLLGSLIAFTQTPYPNPFTAPAPFSLNWWRYPLERNAILRLPLIEADLNDIYALPDSDLIWAVGSGGIILHSNDGGQSWQRQSLQGSFPAAEKAAARWFELIPAAFAADAPLSKKEALPYQEQQKQQLLPPQNLKIQLPVQQQQLPEPKQEPEQPLAQQSRDPELTTLRAVYFIDGKNGWIVGDAGLILRTSDGGNSWQVQTSAVSTALYDLQFVSPEQGWIAGDRGTLLRTDNGGQNWQVIDTNTISKLNGLFFIDPERGWVVGDSGTIRRTSNAGTTWQRLNVAADYRLGNLYFASAELGWAVGADGIILRTEDGGSSWRRQDSGTDAQLYRVQFIGPELGWANGFAGIIVRTVDGGEHWEQLPSDSQAALAGSHFLDDRRGWLVGSLGTVLQTHDGGLSWQPRSREAEPAISGEYRRYPAPWFYLSWLLAGLLLLPLVRQPKQLLIEQKSVADMLVSDKPLEAGEPDALNFGLIARSLSRYLRNDNTQPPLTIAITGEWGTGKSSLMNLLKADLQHFGVRPVWFNAWHHQKETNLLASLLDNIRHQAVPNWWSLAGLNFRVNLLLVRGWRNCLPLLLVLFVFAISAGIVCNPDFHPVKDNLFNMQHISLDLSDMLEALLKRFPFLTLSASSVALFIAVFRGFIAFGLDPKKLIPTIPGRLQVKNLNVELSFRQKFAREFKDVTSALQPRTMLILIDDLDRCQAEHVLEILETINYLVSSGKCYVVLGMARERVERCIGAAFKEIAEDMIDDQIGGQPQDNGRRKRVEFARQYLEKLINIEVPVPVATPGQSRLLLAPEQKEQQAPTLTRQLLALSKSCSKRLIPWLLLLLVLWGGFWLGQNYVAEEKADSPGASTTQTATTDAAGTERQTTRQAEQTPGKEAQKRATYTPGQSADYPKGLIVFPLAVLIAASLIQLLRRPEYRVQDSPEFVQALTVWHPLIAAKRNTPRSIKRFLNRVRYFAMVNRDHNERATNDKPLSSEEPGKPVLRLEEATLVALGALHHVHPQLVIDDRLFNHFSQNTIPHAADLNELKLSGKLATALEEALQNHAKAFGGWSCSKDQRALFLEISQGIQII